MFAPRAVLGTQVVKMAIECPVGRHIRDDELVAFAMCASERCSRIGGAADRQPESRREHLRNLLKRMAKKRCPGSEAMGRA